MDKTLSFKSYAAIGFMLFALFFGAGNLIFPAQLGQNAGSNVWPAMLGFLVTGVGLPLLGILAIGFSKSNSLQDLASRVHPVYGLLFTVILYLTIGPFFALPRTGAVAYDIGFSPFISEGMTQTGLFVFSVLFFGISLWFSLNPTKLIDRVGKILAPVIVVALLVLLAMVVVKPMGSPEAPQEAYTEGAFLTGFTEGYNTMDALASLVFGVIVISSVRKFGVASSSGILKATVKSGLVASALLAVVYTGIAYLGATSTSTLGLFDNGGPVLSGAASYYFGTFGNVLLGLVLTLACLTTAIGLVIATSEYFHSLTPKVSYKLYAVIFSVFSLIVTNAGLSNIITFSIPVLMFLYPLAIVLILLAFLSPLFHHDRFVYVSVIAITLFISIVDGLKTLTGLLEVSNPAWLQLVIDFYTSVLPFYDKGLGWLIPVAAVLLLTGMIARIRNSEASQAAHSES